MNNPEYPLYLLQLLTPDQRADLAAGEMLRAAERICRKWHCKVATVVQFHNGDILEPFGQNVFTAEDLPEPTPAEAADKLIASLDEEPKYKYATKNADEEAKP